MALHPVQRKDVPIKDYTTKSRNCKGFEQICDENFTKVGELGTTDRFRRSAQRLPCVKGTVAVRRLRDCSFLQVLYAASNPSVIAFGAATSLYTREALRGTNRRASAGEV